MSVIGLNILVIGGGIGGLAVARALALRGGSVTLLEQAEAIAEVGAGLQISPNGFAVLDALGLGQDLVRGSVRANAVSLRDYRRSEVLRLDLGRLENRNYYFTHRADLIEILAHGAREAGVRIRLLHKVDRVDPGDRPRVHTANGAVIEADVVIGADGLHSCLRPALNGDASPRFTGQVAWRTIIPNDANRPPEAWVHMGPGRHMVSYPLRGGSALNLVAVQERHAWVDEGWSHQDSPDTLRATFADFGPEVQKMLARVETVHLWGLFRHPVARHWQGGNSALLGDAAHPTLPFLAQGACMALEDAWALADELDNSEDTASGLAAYQARRAARASRVINAATGNAWKYHLRSAPVRFAAHTALKVGGALAPSAMLHQFDWIYNHDETAAA
ncbi:3-hydroxybenzoate 6-hydroxylase 1 [Thalassovita gelatinovora]|uniref:3-hydroxybenzoate 6-hydroxylase 1 n=1 Tax=Thalassovita gelatinovora TaxID=53501 RepID=A0A0P1G1R0_THAGE|nr:FAD-dependent oxidoreductase [Thalassovita gelatinovora]QIZ79657.1 monooxygenase [Thalassovita gelatinovora]CUH66620.1 3-hydroxybenzoate 6-hydroxylase 1 [Thalassovita gelatinovora]SEQ39148.1 salicylate hydroxylase [Thalassovita gelatinovora]